MASYRRREEQLPLQPPQQQQQQHQQVNTLFILNWNFRYNCHDWGSIKQGYFLLLKQCYYGENTGTFHNFFAPHVSICPPPFLYGSMESWSPHRTPCGIFGTPYSTKSGKFQNWSASAKLSIYLVTAGGESMGCLLDCVDACVYIQQLEAYTDCVAFCGFTCTDFRWINLIK